MVRAGTIWHAAATVSRAGQASTVFANWPSTASTRLQPSFEELTQLSALSRRAHAPHRSVCVVRYGRYSNRSDL
jgi:hypothetical protein